MRSKRSRLVAAATAALLVLTASVALADNLHSDLQASGNGTFTAGGSTTITYLLVANGGNCNVDASNGATMLVNAPAGLTATPSSVSFTGCGVGGAKQVVFTSNSPDTYVFTPTISGGLSGSDNNGYNTNQVKNSTITVEAATATNAAPVITAFSLVHDDACTVDASVAWTDDDDLDSHVVTFSWGDSTADTVVESATSPTSEKHTYQAAGIYTVGVTVSDGSDSDTDSASFTTKNTASGILQPINPNGSSVFKINSTVPVKITVTDCDGLAVDSIAPAISLKRVSSSAGPINEDVVATSTSGADTGSQMRWSPEGQQYIYNLATKGRAEGGYQLTISDSSLVAPVVATFGLRK